ncbi:hypothetical protein N7536_004744 [Penicillium majusculum]|nr:hypothetical protein N7536_004744 [Penicillium majusculum]
MHILAYLNPVNTKSHYLAVHMRTCWPSNRSFHLLYRGRSYKSPKDRTFFGRGRLFTGIDNRFYIKYGVSDVVLADKTFASKQNAY